MLATVPGVGIMGASAIAATIADPGLFRSAWRNQKPSLSTKNQRLGGPDKRL
jgi:hypothetical protein